MKSAAAVLMPLKAFTIGRRGIYTPLASNPLCTFQWTSKKSSSLFLRFIYLFKTLCLSLLPSLFCFVLYKLVDIEWASLCLRERDDHTVKKAIYTHLDPCSLDWLPACDNMSSKPSERNNLMVHAASVTLSYSARPRRGMDLRSVREREREI